MKYRKVVSLHVPPVDDVVVIFAVPDERLYDRSDCIPIESEESTNLTWVVLDLSEFCA